MRRRGTMLTCDICRNSIFVKNLRLYSRSWWKFVPKSKMDICPSCVLKKATYEKQKNTKITWEELAELTCRKKTDILLS